MADNELISQVVESHYEKIIKIGQGTFGEVFKARDKNDPNKIVAMKKIIMENDTFPITTQREIRILQSVEHENIVRLIEVCSLSSLTNDSRSEYYIVLEFCKHDLNGILLNPHVKFSLGEIKKVLQQLLNGLYQLHYQKILHRDIKPSNVLITKYGVLKIADFGLAREFKNDGNMSNHVVTLWYRPPELLLGARDYGPPIDIWSAGCIMAEMWVRSPILQGNTEEHQLVLISQLCGSITPKVWPGVEKLDFYTGMDLPIGHKRKVRDLLKKYLKNPLAYDLLDHLLALNPANRYDADSALMHAFFYTNPMPTDLCKMMLQHKHSMFTYTVSQRGLLHYELDKPFTPQAVKHVEPVKPDFQDPVFGGPSTSRAVQDRGNQN